MRPRVCLSNCFPNKSCGYNLWGIHWFWQIIRISNVKKTRTIAPLDGLNQLKMYIITKPTFFLHQNTIGHSALLRGRDVLESSWCSRQSKRLIISTSLKQQGCLAPWHLLLFPFFSSYLDFLCLLAIKTTTAWRRRRRLKHCIGGSSAIALWLP